MRHALHGWTPAVAPTEDQVRFALHILDLDVYRGHDLHSTATRRISEATARGDLAEGRIWAAALARYPAGGEAS